jgi:citrate synthase
VPYAALNTAAQTKWRLKFKNVMTILDEAEADIRERVGRKEVVIGFGHPVYTVSDPRNVVIKEVAHELSAEQNNMKNVRHC